MEIDIFIKGNTIDLICLNESIAAESNWKNWFNDEEATKYMQKHYYPNTREIQVEFYKNSIENNPSKLQCGIYHKEDQVLIGVISLNDIDFINRNTELSVIIGESKYQNIVVLLEAQRLLLRHAFETLNMNKVYGGSAIKEIDMLFCRVLGYEREGIRSKHMYKNGDYLDVYMFAISREKYFKKRDRWF